MRSRDTARAEQQPRPAASGDFGLDLAQIPIHEAEANRVAEQIATAPLDASRERAPSLTSVQAADTERAAAPPAVHAVVRAAGQQLTPAVRARFEPRLSHDLSSVRVHTDAAAAQSARDINARAYTVGQHVVFDNGQLAPHTAAGRQLLAHELTHVVQQSGNGPSVQRKPGPDAKDKQSVVIARQRAQALVAQMKEDGALTAAAKATMIADLDFFEGAAWQA
ncbi:MAG TPA: DUF4157 domain-containing protein, partial [Polyangiaceae bacterium]|nr:DUF4157 domain-containing protein [Polyangiaceae bacterium]